MPEKTAPSETFTKLSELLATCQTVTELLNLASSATFRSETSKLPPTELDELRGTYKTRQGALDGRVRLAEFDGQPIRLVDIQYWHSDRFDEGATGGEGVTLVFRPESDLSKRYKAPTSSAVIVRFANTLSVVPTESEPLRVVCQQVPVNDPDRAAKGQKRWDVKRLPSGQSRSGAPF